MVRCATPPVQHRAAAASSFLLCPLQDEKRLAMPLADRSILGTTTSILCSIVPIYWA